MGKNSFKIFTAEREGNERAREISDRTKIKVGGCQGQQRGKKFEKFRSFRT